MSLVTDNPNYEAWLHWNVSHRCNLNCIYCFRYRPPGSTSGPENPRNNPAQIDVRALRTAIEESGKTFGMGFTGGDPFTVSNIMDVFKEVTRKHYIQSIYTNLTSRKVREFCETVDPGKVGVVCASLHIKELERLNLVETYVSNFLLCRQKGFETHALEVGHPSLAQEARKYQEFFGRRGVDLEFVPFHGVHDGREYPYAYTQAELEAFGDGVRRRIGQHTGQKGKVCNAGYNVGVVLPSGEIQSCFNMNDNIGNIYGKIRFKKGLVICPFSYCVCPQKEYNPRLYRKAMEECTNRLIRNIAGDFLVSNAKREKITRLKKWEKTGCSLFHHVEALSTRVGDTQYIIGGYRELTRMNDRMQMYDMQTGRWTYGPELPEGFPESHAGITNDGRFIYVVSGQVGPGCFPATDRVWAFDTEALSWHAMAPLPAKRYAATLSYVNGNLHLISGSTEDRCTVSNDHFILRIRDGHGTEPKGLPSLARQSWIKGPPIPAGGDHAAVVVLGGMIYIVGGEHGEAPMSLDFSNCVGTYQAHDYLFRYDPIREEWSRLADMPRAVSNMDFMVLPINGRIVVFGGAGDGLVFTDKVQEYDPAADRWRIIGRLPVPIKGGSAWYWKGAVYINGGQITAKSKLKFRRECLVTQDTRAAEIKVYEPTFANSFMNLFFT